MQKIRSILKITNSGAALCDNYGSTAGIGLELMLGTSCMLEFELRGESSGSSAVLPDYPVEHLAAASYYCALDFSCFNSDDPPLLIFTGVSVAADEAGRTVFTVPVNNSAVDRIVSVMKERMSTELYCELGGYDSEGNSVFAWQFKLTMRSRVYLGADNGNESIAPDPAYYTAVQIDAMLAGLSQSPGCDIAVKDAGDYFEGENVEAVLQEIGGQLDGIAEILEGI